MLTKDLLRIRKVSGSVKPQFIDPENKLLLAGARELIDTYEMQAGCERGSIQEMVHPFVQSHRDVKLYKGLNKILLDRCEFQQPETIDFPKGREQLLTTAAKLYKSGQLGSLDTFRSSVTSANPDLSSVVEEGFYGDLPENEKLVKVPKVLPKELLERYNVSLVQALLLYCDSLSLTIRESKPAQLRNLLRYLKFFRLLMEIELTDAPGKGLSVTDGATVKIVVNGPLSLFENTQKYGFQLACFFPVICRLDKWCLSCKLKMGKHDYRLKLDETSGLVCHYRNISDFVPEEFLLFEKQFQQKSQHWELIEQPDIINFGDQRIVFPDFSFRHVATEKVVNLELFHRWHSSQLLEHLAMCEDAETAPLILGVDRFLYNNDKIREQLDNSPYFQQNGFAFRDFPGCDAVLSCLNRQLKNDDESFQQAGFDF